MAQSGTLLTPQWRPSSDSSSEEEEKEEDEAFRRPSKKQYKVHVANSTNVYTVRVTCSDEGPTATQEANDNKRGKEGGLVRPHMKETFNFGMKAENKKVDIKIQVVYPMEMKPIEIKEVNNKSGLIFADMNVFFARKDPFVRNWWKSGYGQDFNPHHSRDDSGKVLKRAPSSASMNSYLAGGKKCMLCVQSKGSRGTKFTG